MTKGFKVQTISNKERALQVLKTDYFLKDGQHHELVKGNRKLHFWNNFASKDVSCTREELFTPCDSRFVDSLDLTTTPAGKPLHTLFIASKGFWKLRVVRSSVNDRTDFTVSVLVGNKWRYYPDAIKRHIIRDHGLNVFHQWRDVVLADIDSLRQLIGAANFDGYAYSANCCDSSKRLCQRAGLEVQRDIAFLFPNQK